MREQTGIVQVVLCFGCKDVIVRFVFNYSLATFLHVTDQKSVTGAQVFKYIVIDQSNQVLNLALDLIGWIKNIKWCTGIYDPNFVCLTAHQ